MRIRNPIVAQSVVSSHQASSSRLRSALSYRECHHRKTRRATARQGDAGLRPTLRMARIYLERVARRSVSRFPRAGGRRRGADLGGAVRNRSGQIFSPMWQIGISQA